MRGTSRTHISGIPSSAPHASAFFSEFETTISIARSGTCPFAAVP
jgi:hypothetical protein